MLRQKDDSIAKLRIEKNELDNQCQKLQGDFNEFQHLSAELAKRLEESKVRNLSPFLPISTFRTMNTIWR